MKLFIHRAITDLYWNLLHTVRLFELSIVIEAVIVVTVRQHQPTSIVGIVVSQQP